MAAAISILNRQRSLKLPITHQVLLHPATDTTSDIGTGIFWGPEWMEQQRAAYFSSVEERSNITASPGLMTIEQTKDYMPPTTMITSEHDAFRPEGEAFAKLLQTAGVPCGHLQAFASLHAVQLFNQSRTSPTAGMIMSAISGKLREVLDYKK
jgi:acetyl esterase/lipase